MQVRTRFAPSPTGYMHLGGLRGALFAYLYAKKHNGVFILRIEDTDQQRFVPGATQVIYDTLRECGILWDEGPDIGGPCAPYIQSQRKDTYLPYAHQLIESGHAYRCFCTKEDIELAKAQAADKGEVYKYDKRCLHLPKDESDRRAAQGESHTIRLDVPQTGETPFDDLVFGQIVTPNETLDDIVLIKADGMPTYNFANVIDDHLMNITHVMRGKEYLSSTPKYNLIYQALGWDIPQYIHLPEIMRDQHSKLSKRDGDAYYTDFIEKGFLRDAIINYLALQCWSPGDNREFFTVGELIHAFDVSGISKSTALFDIAKLTWFNAEYIKKLPTDEYAAYANPWLDKALGEGSFDRELLCRLLQSRTERFDQLPEMVDFLTTMPDYPIDFYLNKKSKSTIETSITAMDAAQQALSQLDNWSESAIHDLLMAIPEKLNMKTGQALWPVRIALSGKQSTPGGAVEIAALLGREETLTRMERGLTYLRANTSA